MTPDAVAGRPWTLEEVWHTYGERIEIAARRILLDDGDVRRACLQVMLDAAKVLEGEPGEAGSPAMLPWLLAHTRDVCTRPLPDGYLARRALRMPMPDAIPARLRHRFWLLADRPRADAAVRRILGLSPLTRRNGHGGALSLVPLAWRRFRSACSAAADHARALGLRTYQSTVVNTPTVSGFQAAASNTPGVTEAVAAAAAAVVLTVTGPGLDFRRPGHTELRTAAAAIRSEGPLTQPVVAALRLEPGEDHATSPEPPPARRDTPDPENAPGAEGPPVPHAPAPTDAVAPGALEAGPAAKVDARPVEPGAKPVQKTRHGDDEEERHTQDAGSVSLDVDGDGGDDVSVGTPFVFVNCPDPEERDLVTGTVCPAIAESADSRPDD